MVSETFLCKQKKIASVSTLNYTEYYSSLVAINRVGNK